jgi:hypothetical protein
MFSSGIRKNARNKQSSNHKNRTAAAAVITPRINFLKSVVILLFFVLIYIALECEIKGRRVSIIIII